VKIAWEGEKERKGETQKKGNGAERGEGRSFARGKRKGRGEEGKTTSLLCFKARKGKGVTKDRDYFIQC